MVTGNKVYQQKYLFFIPVMPDNLKLEQAITKNLAAADIMNYQ